MASCLIGVAWTQSFTLFNPRQVSTTELAKVWLCLKALSLQQKDKEPENGLQMLGKLAAMLEDMVKQMGYKSSLLTVIFLGRSWCKWG
ncbi:unnamed protein product [Sphagnum jensenii]